MFLFSLDHHLGIRLQELANGIESSLTLALSCSGFNRTDEWGFRACEPSRNIISSMALVLLKTGIIHPTSPGDEPPHIDQQQMATAQKLLLFWRKPAVNPYPLATH